MSLNLKKPQQEENQRIYENVSKVEKKMSLILNVGIKNPSEIADTLKIHQRLNGLYDEMQNVVKDEELSNDEVLQRISLIEGEVDNLSSKT